MRHVDAFDPDAFNISTSESALIDPQHRMLLEAVWQSKLHYLPPLLSMLESRLAFPVMNTAGLSTTSAHTQQQAEPSASRAAEFRTHLDSGSVRID